jgi:methionyl aminopeptidase
MVKIKSPEEIVVLRESGRRLGTIVEELKKAIKPGVSTWDIDLLAEKLIRDGGDIPSLKNYCPYGAKIPYPATICISLNDEIVHGIPAKDRIIKDGDVVSVDICLTHEGMVTDMATTVTVGKVPAHVETLLAETQRALFDGIKAARVGGRIGDISAAIERVGNRNGYGIIRELGGHGVGHGVHEDPYVPNFGFKGTGPLLKPGMVIAIEPMFTLGSEEIRQLEDGYTIVSQDHSLSAHFEHTIAITKDGVEILTQV